jgi:hypothetical protein
LQSGAAAAGAAAAAAAARGRGVFGPRALHDVAARRAQMTAGAVMGLRRIRSPSFMPD